MKLDGKVSLVSACGRGIGREIALTLAREGSNLIINTFSEENTQAVAKELEGLGVKVVAIAGDITRSGVILETVAAGIEAFGQIDILVNNAGVAGAPGSTGTGFRDVDWEFTWQVNVKGLSDVTEAVLPQMRERRSGKIINISSVAAKAAKYQTAYYATTKMAVVAYTQALAREFAAENINVNAVAPGRIWTQFHQDWMKEREALGDEAVAGKDKYDVFMGALKEVIPMGRPQEPSDIGALVTFLASEEARNITGQTIQCDGGQVMV